MARRISRTQMISGRKRPWWDLRVPFLPLSSLRCGQANAGEMSR